MFAQPRAQHGKLRNPEPQLRFTYLPTTPTNMLIRTLVGEHVSEAPSIRGGFPLRSPNMKKAIAILIDGGFLRSLANKANARIPIQRIV
jgi:hypothetical protein